MVKLKLDQVKEAIKIANEQLGGKWRLPNRVELENLVCHNCKTVKINKNYSMIKLLGFKLLK